MKSKLISSIVIAVLLQSSSMYGAQNPSQQSWGDWFRTKYRQYSAGATESARQGVAAVQSRVAKAAAPSIEVARTLRDRIDTEESLGAAGKGALSVFLIYNLAGPAVLWTIGNLIKDYRNNYITRPAVIEGIKNNLKAAVVYNGLLYPTRSSKIHVLLKKDEFLEFANVYINDTDGLLGEACSQLSKEISSAKYSEEQKEEDRQIDSHIASLRKAIDSKQSLEDKIKALELIQGDQKSIIQMRAYLSLYYRLKNQLEVKNQFALRQKQAEEISPKKRTALQILAGTGK